VAGRRRCRSARCRHLLLQKIALGFRGPNLFSQMADREAIVIHANEQKRDSGKQGFAFR